MRVTIDLDDQSLLSFIITITKGYIMLKRLPDLTRRTKKGYHLIWRHLNISQNKSYILRKFIGDDKNRLSLDMSSKKRIKQILFTTKKVTYF